MKCNLTSINNIPIEEVPSEGVWNGKFSKISVIFLIPMVNLEDMAEN